MINQLLIGSGAIFKRNKISKKPFNIIYDESLLLSPNCQFFQKCNLKYNLFGFDVNGVEFNNSV